jgi:P pilus assembly chaperone PapD
MNTKSIKKIKLFLKTKKTIFSSLSMMLLMGASFSSQGVSLTSYRLYLDDNNRTESFIIFAKGNVAEKCSLKLKHFSFDDNGNMSLYTGENIPDNSSEPWIRFSPKNFTVQPRTPQTIRFTMRRKPNTEANEYRSYLAVSCKDEVDEAEKETAADRPNITVQPNLVQNVPIIVRTGPLEATAQFTDIEIENDIITANLKRSGERSLYGRLSLVNNKTDEEYRYFSGVSVYTETYTHQFKFSIKGDEVPPLEDLALLFVEDENYGGSLTIKKSIR